MPITNCVQIVVSAKIKVLINKKWKERFCVVARTAYSSTVKLFVYKDPSDYKKSIDLAAQTPFDIIYGLDSVSNSDRSPVIAAIALTCEERLVLLGFNSYNDLTFWLEKISEAIQDASYRARFVKCESIGKPIQQQLAPSGGESGGGEGRLHVQPSRLCFYREPAESHRSCLSVWPLQYVKRYMVNEAMGCFVFEGDIGCGKLRGMQYFQCDKRQELYLDMKAACSNKPLPSIAHRRASQSAPPASQVDDPRRPTASRSIDIPKPRGGGGGCTGVQQQQQQLSETARDGSRTIQPSACRCRCHRRVDVADSNAAQQKLQQQQQQPSTLDSGFGGDANLPQRSAAAGRDYCNLLPMSSAAPAIGLVARLKAATLAGSLADSPAAGRTTWRRRLTSHQPGQSKFTIGEASQAGEDVSGRLVRYSSDLCVPAAVGAECCSSCCSSCRDPAGSADVHDEGVCGSSSCGSSSGASLAAANVLMRKPRHGVEYVSRQRVASLSLSSSGCYANLPQQPTAPTLLNRPQLAEEPEVSAEAAPPPPPCRSAPAAGEADSPLLLYATLDHSDCSEAVANRPPVLASAGAVASSNAEHRLNYTEVDHGKTSAFREIAEQLVGNRKQQHPPGRSESASSATGHRRSFIRIFQRGHSFRHD